MNSDSITIIKKNNNIFYKIKNNVYKRVNNYKSKTYLKIFVLGDKSSLDNKDIFKNLGIIHLFSLSGLHISLLCYILRKLKVKNIFIYLILFAFLFLTDFHISTIRSGLSFIFLNINNKYKLNISSEDRLIILAYLLLIFNPYYIYDLGYVFSFVITYSIIYFKSDNYIKISLISFITSIPLLISSNFSINLFNEIFIYINKIYI